MYFGAGNKGSTAVINTLSNNSYISLPIITPEFYMQGLELASIKYGFNYLSNMKSNPNNYINL